MLIKGEANTLLSVISLDYNASIVLMTINTRSTLIWVIVTSCVDDHITES